ncbi:MAG: ribonuclease PH [Clostridiales bacterium]|nr:ribonuclease PH [Clostridiales bacterium]
MERLDGRTPAQLRPVTIEMGFQKNAAGSCLVSFGNTRVICAASVENNVPPFLTGKGKGWLTAEYAMLPASTQSRKRRDGVKQDGRSVEIQRLIGRSLRAVVDLEKLGERTIRLDCDVLDADGGTRTASITGAWCALAMAVEGLKKQGLLQESPILSQVAAVSCGVVEDTPIVDLCYTEDSHAQVDMNFVMTGQGQFVEIQGTGEGRAFTREEMQQMLCMGQAAIETLFLQQKQALEALYE